MKNVLVSSAVLALTALLSACDTHPSTPAPGTLDPATLSGKLSGWTFGGKTQVLLYDSTAEKGAPIPDATISADGVAVVTLPSQPLATFDLLKTCAFTGSSSKTRVNVELADVSVYSAQNDYLGELVQTRDSDGLPLTRMYSDGDATVKGSLSCADDVISLDLTLKSGWNVVANTATTTGFSITTVDSVTPRTLKFLKADQGAYVALSDTSPINLKPGQTVTRTARIYQVGDLNGAVNLSASQAGITVSPGTVNLPSASVQRFKAQRPPFLKSSRVRSQALEQVLTFGLNDDAVTYTGDFDLQLSQNGQVYGSTTLATSIVAPSLDLSIGGQYSDLYFRGYQGETVKLMVRLRSQQGFSGPATVTVAGLPAGVSAAPVTVNVMADATSTVAVPLQIGAGAAAGTATISVSANKANTVKASLMIKPARVPLGTQAYSLAPAARGVWAGSANRSDLLQLRRILNGQAAATVSVQDAFSEPLRIPGGDIYLVNRGFGSAPAVWRINDSGAVTPLKLDQSVTDNMSYGVVDAQGRIWYVAYDSGRTVVGYSPNSLFVWDPATGKSTVADGTRNYSATYASSLSASGRGRYVVYSGNDNTRAVLIDTQTRVVSDVASAGSGAVGKAVVGDSGQVWFLNLSGGQLNRAETDGTVTTLPTPSGVNYVALLGLDRTRNVLWARGTSSIYAVDAATGQVTVYPTDELNTAVLNTDGGLTYQFSDGGTFYLSQLP